MAWDRVSQTLMCIKSLGDLVKCSFPFSGCGRAQASVFLSSSQVLQMLLDEDHTLHRKGIGHQKGFIFSLGRAEVGAGRLPYHFVKSITEYQGP